MPRGPTGSMPMPGMIGQNAFSPQPTGGGNMPDLKSMWGGGGSGSTGSMPNFQSILQAIMSTKNGMASQFPGMQSWQPPAQQSFSPPSPNSQPTSPSNNTDQSADGGNFWNPNEGVQRPQIGNTPSTTTPSTPFAMPRQPQQFSGGIPPPMFRPAVRGAAFGYNR